MGFLIALSSCSVDMLQYVSQTLCMPKQWFSQVAPEVLFLSVRASETLCKSRDSKCLHYDAD